MWCSLLTGHLKAIMRSTIFSDGCFVYLCETLSVVFIAIYNHELQLLLDLFAEILLYSTLGALSDFLKCDHS